MSAAPVVHVRRLEVGQPVRLFFGSLVREGPIESITNDGRLQVRLRPGWLHTCKPGEVFRVLSQTEPLHAVALL